MLLVLWWVVCRVCKSLCGTHRYVENRRIYCSGFGFGKVLYLGIAVEGSSVLGIGVLGISVGEGEVVATTQLSTEIEASVDCLHEVSPLH